MLSSALLIKLRIDDAVDAIPVHMVNGCWGLIATGLLSSPRLLELTYRSSKHAGLFYGGDGSLLLCQIMAILFIFGWTFITMFPFFIWLNYRGWLRADSLEELVGLDVSYHGRSTHGEDGNEIKQEYIDAYNRYKSTIKRHHGHNNSNPDREQFTTITAESNTRTTECIAEHEEANERQQQKQNLDGKDDDRVLDTYKMEEEHMYGFELNDEAASTSNQYHDSNLVYSDDEYKRNYMVDEYERFNSNEPAKVSANNYLPRTHHQLYKDDRSTMSDPTPASEEFRNP